MHNLVGGPTTFLLWFDNIFRDQDTFLRISIFCVFRGSHSKTEMLTRIYCHKTIIIYYKLHSCSEWLNHQVSQLFWENSFQNRGIDFGHHCSLSHMQAGEEYGAVPPYFSHFSTICNFSGSSERSGSFDVVCDQARWSLSLTFIRSIQIRD